MKTRLLPFLLAVALCHATPTQAQWLEIAPPFPDSLNLICWGISVVDENVVWGNARINTPQWFPDLPERQYFYKTTDGGQTWKFGEIKESLHNWKKKSVDCLFALDSNTAWAINNHYALETLTATSIEFDSSEILKTMDGGDTWVQQTLPVVHRNDMMGIRFFNQNEGAVWGEVSEGGPGTYPVGWHIVCYYTEDGGETWQLAATPPSIDEGWVAEVGGFDGAYEVLGNNIWFGTNKSRVFHSKDRGKTWEVSAPVWPGRAMTTFAFRDSLNGICFSTLDSAFNSPPEEIAFHTQDGGKSWTPQPPRPHTNWLTDLECVPGSGGVYWYVSGNNCDLSTDNGNTWTYQATPRLFWYAKFLSPKVGWAASAFHPTPPTSQLFMYKWIGDSLVRDEGLNSTKTLAGSGIEGRVDGNPGTGRFWNPKGMAIDHAGNVFVADDYNHCIRKIAPNGKISTLAGTGTPGYANGPGASAQFNRPQDVALDGAGNLYVADANNSVIRKIAPDGMVSLFAGQPGISGETNGPALQATFGRPAALAIDGVGNLYVGGSATIRKISTAGQVSTVHAAPGNIPCIDVDRYGNLYFADNATLSVERLSPGGQLAVLAGSGSGCTDGNGAAAQFGSLDDLDADDAGNVYVADGANARIRKIDPAGNVVTLVGSDCLNGYGLDRQPVEGSGDVAQLGRVRGILLKPSESLLVTSWDNDMVREIRLGSLPRFNSVVTKTDVSLHYRSMPVSQVFPLAFSGTVANTGSTSLAGVRMSAAVTNGAAQVWSKTTLPKTIAPGDQAELTIAENLTLTTPGVYQLQLKIFTVLDQSNPFGSYAEEIAVSDSILSADDGHVFFYDNIIAVAPGSKASYGQVYTVPATDTLTGFSLNAELQQASFYFSVYAMNDSLPGDLMYTSDTVFSISNDFPHDYYHRLPKSLILPPGKYLFALEQWNVAGSLGMGLDTDRNDQSAWYRSADAGVDAWTPIYHFWGEQTAPVYMLRPVFGVPVQTVTQTEEKTSAALGVHIAPNPVTDQFSVYIEADPSELFILNVYDAPGRQVLQATVPGGTKTFFDFGQAPAGIYRLNVIGDRKGGTYWLVKG